MFRDGARGQGHRCRGLRCLPVFATEVLLSAAGKRDCASHQMDRTIQVHLTLIRIELAATDLKIKHTIY